MRRVCYVSGSRADFGLIRSTLERAHTSPGLTVCVCVTGMHLSARHGETVRDIESTGLPVCARIPVDLSRSTGLAMARAVGAELIGMAEAFERDRPDLVLVLGDRGEMLAGALAALHLNIPVVHVHGGELSGTVDEPVRHAISKVAHYHLVATEGARERLIRMGEHAERVFVTGAPGLDGLEALAQTPRAELARGAGFDADRPIALVLFHPVVQQEEDLTDQTRLLREAILDSGLQAVWLLPNADAGGDAIRAVLESTDAPELRLFTHLARSDFVSWMAAVDVMIGNSSSGIIEAPTFGTPVVNVGSRQTGRERSDNIVDAPLEAAPLRAAIAAAAARGRRATPNAWGDGRAGERIVDLLERLPLDRALLEKANAY